MANNKDLNWRAKLDATGFQRGAAQVKKAQQGIASSTAIANKASRRQSQSFVEVARGLEDAQYGFRGVQNNINQLAFTMGLGGPMILAITAMGVAIQYLITNWEELGGTAATIASDISKELQKSQGAIASTLLYAEVLETATAGTDDHTYALEQLKKKGYDPAKQSLQEFLVLQQKQILLNAVEAAAGKKVEGYLATILKNKAKIVALNASVKGSNANFNEETGAFYSGNLTNKIGQRIKAKFEGYVSNVDEARNEITKLLKISAAEVSKIFGDEGFLSLLTGGGGGGGKSSKALGNYKKALKALQDANAKFGLDQYEKIEATREQEKAAASATITDKAVLAATLAALDEKYDNAQEALATKQLERAKKLTAAIVALKDKEVNDKIALVEKEANALLSRSAKFAQLGLDDQSAGLGAGVDDLKDKFASGTIGIEAYASGIRALGNAYGELTPKQLEAIQALETLNRAAEAAVEGAIVGLASAIGSALVAPDDFGSDVLKVIGSFLSSIGSALIAYGVAMDAFKEAFKNPYVAIAAGVALVIIGSAISKSAAKGPQGSSGVESYSHAASKSSVDPTFVQGSGGSGLGIVGKIRGNDTILALQVAQDRRNGQTGSYSFG